MFDRLLDHLVAEAVNRSDALTLHKLSAALISIFKQTPERWSLCLQHVANSFALGTAAPYDDPSAAGRIAELNGRALEASIHFARDLVEEVAQLSSETAAR